MTAFQNPSSYFRKYTQVSEEEALEYARTTWRTINRPNLVENVAPTRGRATTCGSRAITEASSRSVRPVCATRAASSSPVSVPSPVVA
ncbi:Pantothenate kinase [Streptomyces fumanus]